MNPITLSVLLPVRNETRSLEVILKVLRAVVEESHEAIVVVDTPEDRSIPVVEALKPTYAGLRWVLSPKGGVINAIKTGVANAQGDYVLIFAADEMGPVIAIEKMIGLMREGCDFVSCTRYALGGRRAGGSWIGHLLSRTANWIFHRLIGSPFSDGTTGIKMFRREIFPRLELCSRPVGWAVAFEMAIKAQYLGVRLGEVPIVSIDRLFGGQSTFKLGPWVAEYFRWLVYGMKRAAQARLGMNPAPRLPLMQPLESH